MTRFKSLLLLLLAALASGSLHAETSDSVTVTFPSILRPVRTTVLLGGGYSRLTETYLAPFATSGWDASLALLRSQALKSDPQNWVGSLWLSLSGGNTHTLHTSSGSMWNVMLNAELSAQRRFTFPCRLTLSAGPALELSAGAAYRAANSNNPVAANAAASVGAAATASFPVRIGRLPVTLSYRASLPLAGVFFMPQYGQLYYELYLGDTQGTAHFGWPGNRFSYHHLLSADLHFGATTLTVGYDLRVLSASANHLDATRSTNSLMIGISTTRISLSHSTAAKASKAIIMP